MLLQRGVQFAPGYRLQEFLGRGQFGQVWRAAAPGGASAAVKFIDLSDGQGQKEYDGIRRVKQIRQANLMPITAIWLLDGEGRVIEEAPDEAAQTIDLTAANVVDQTGVVVMPQPDASWLVVAMLLGGMSLQQRLRDCVSQGLPGIPTKELISLMDESAKGLDFLNSPIHDLGEGPIAIQHCDVKPANIVLIGNSAVVCDFGLARILTRNQATATSASGTPAYMAPEAIEGKPSRTSDQYSLAVTYYQLRTGTLPVNDGSLWEVLDSHRRGKLNFDRVSAGERQVLRRATHLDWQQRFESNVEMIDALREALRVDHPSTASSIAGGRGSTGGSDRYDPSATIDSELLVDVASDAANDSTQRDVVTDTNAVMPSHSEQDSTRPSPSPNEANRAVPWLASLAGVLLLAALGGWFFFGHNDETSLNHGGGSGDDADATTWMERARSELQRGANSEAALAFSHAMQMDASLSQLQPAHWPSHDTPVTGIEFGPDSRLLVTLGEDALPVLWRFGVMSPSAIASMAAPTHFKIPSPAIVADLACDVSPDGKWLVTGGHGGELSVWKIADASSTASQSLLEDSHISLVGHSDDIVDAVWHPDGNVVISLAADNQLGLWELEPAPETSGGGSVSRYHLIDTSKMYESLAIDSSGHFLALVSIKGEVDAFTWSDLVDTLDSPSSPQPRVVTAAGDTARKLALSNHDSATVAIVAGSSGTTTLWSVDSSITQKIASSNPTGAIIESLAVRETPGERHELLIATGTDAGTVDVWAYGAKSTQRHLQASSDLVSSLDISHDGRWICAATRGGSIALFHLEGDETQMCQLDVPGDGAFRVKFDPTDRWLVSGNMDGSVCVWDLEHAKLVTLAILRK